MTLRLTKSVRHAEIPRDREARLERADLGEPPRVPLRAVEARREERVRELEGERLAAAGANAAPADQDRPLGIPVPDRQPGRLGVVGAYPA